MRWRVGTKIISIGVIVLVAFVVIAGFYAVMSRQVDVLMEADQRATTPAEHTAKMRSAFLSARLHERNFDANPDARLAAAVRTAAAEARSELDVMDKLTRQAEIRRDLAEAQTSLDLYAQRFDAFNQLWARLGYDENSGLQGSLRTAVRSIETSLGNDPDPRLSAMMLTLRRHEKDFILRRDRSYLDRFQQSIPPFRAAPTGRHDGAVADARGLSARLRGAGGWHAVGAQRQPGAGGRRRRAAAARRCAVRRQPAGDEPRQAGRRRQAQPGWASAPPSACWWWRCSVLWWPLWSAAASDGRWRR